MSKKLNEKMGKNLAKSGALSSLDECRELIEKAKDVLSAAYTKTETTQIRAMAAEMKDYLRVFKSEIKKL